MKLFITMLSVLFLITGCGTSNQDSANQGDSKKIEENRRSRKQNKRINRRGQKVYRDVTSRGLRNFNYRNGRFKN